MNNVYVILCYKEMNEKVDNDVEKFNGKAIACNNLYCLLFGLIL